LDDCQQAHFKSGMAIASYRTFFFQKNRIYISHRHPQKNLICYHISKLNKNNLRLLRLFRFFINCLPYFTWLRVKCFVIIMFPGKGKFGYDLKKFKQWDHTEATVDSDLKDNRRNKSRTKNIQYSANGIELIFCIKEVFCTSWAWASAEGGKGEPCSAYVFSSTSTRIVKTIKLSSIIIILWCACWLTLRGGGWLRPSGNLNTKFFRKKLGWNFLKIKNRRFFGNGCFFIKRSSLLRGALGATSPWDAPGCMPSATSNSPLIKQIEVNWCYFLVLFSFCLPLKIFQPTPF